MDTTTEEDPNSTQPPPAKEFWFEARGTSRQVEDGDVFMPKFDDSGLIPAIATDADSGELLMVAYMNEEALGQTIRKGEAIYYSRSRKCLWHKGATSGHVQRVIEIRTDCDQDAIWLRVKQEGPGCCHAGYQSCFYRRVATRDELDQRGEGGPVPLSQVQERSYDPKAVYGK